MKALKVLIIEDDSTLNLAYATKLKMEGFDVVTASDGADGFKKATSDPPDVILLDMLMPTMSGTDFLRAYDPKNKHPQTKIVVFSNDSTPGTVEEATELGADRYLTKSTITPNAMVEIIKQVAKVG